MIQDKSNNILVNWELVSINPSNKNWNWSDLFCFWAVSIQSIVGFSLISSLYIVYDLNFFIVVLGGILASLLAFYFSTLVGKPSVKYGLPFPVILRSSIGTNGARYIALLRAIVGIFMFGVQTYFLSKGIGYLIKIFLFSQQGKILDNEIFLIFFMGMNIIDWISFISVLFLQYILFNKGQNFIRSIIKFSAYFVYFGLLLFLILILGENFTSVLNSLKFSLKFQNFITISNFIPLLTVTGTLFAYFSILILNFGDYSRYVKNDKELIIGNLSIILNFILLSFFSILIVLGSDIILTKNGISIDQILTSPNDIIGKFNNTFLTIIVLVFITVASASTNLIANYIPSKNSLINFLPHKLTSRGSAILLIILSFFIGVFWLSYLSQMGVLTMVDTIGSFFGPIFGVIIADYFIIKNTKLESKDLFTGNKDSKYFYSNGWQIKSLYSILIGFIFAASTIWNINLAILQSFSWIIGAFISFIIYYLLASK